MGKGKKLEFGKGKKKRKFQNIFDKKARLKPLNNFFTLVQHNNKLQQNIQLLLL